MDEVVGRGVYIREGNEHILSSEAFRSLWLLSQDSVVPPAIRWPSTAMPPPKYETWEHHDLIAKISVACQMPSSPHHMPAMYQQPQHNNDQSYNFPGQEEWRSSLGSSSLWSSCEGNSQKDLQHNERAGTTTANLLGLDPKARDDLLKFVESLCQDRVERALVVPMTYLLADNLHSKQLILQSRADLTDIKTHLTDVKLAIGQKTELNTTQKTSITYLCKVKVSDPKRTDWENEAIRNEVVVHLKKHAPLKDFKSFFDNPSQARTKALNQFICIQASYAKSTCRNHIKDTLSNSATVAMTIPPSYNAVTVRKQLACDLALLSL
ncbi:hypothetical protein FB45DRAFT_883212 [Roridomyces roridus]|uniref:Uncharacterized protein n=1 Tax=Roridomyces roridus TaxID=1738132 RepID=A0AAD7AWZ7_9AGAR|nr:hypothetical protein FB45DRAFT_883212 [Roridomyces roridus]